MLFAANPGRKAGTRFAPPQASAALTHLAMCPPRSIQRGGSDPGQTGGAGALSRQFEPGQPIVITQGPFAGRPRQRGRAPLCQRLERGRQQQQERCGRPDPS